MVISKNLKEYVERTIHNKFSNANAEIWEKKQKIFNTIRDELNSIQAKAVDKCIKIIEEKGLTPEDFGYHSYGDGGFPIALPYRRGLHVNHLDVQNCVQEILLKIELDEIPKNEVKDYIDNYDVSKYLEK